MRVSVQASQYAYCTPRDDEGPYSKVEVGYPSVAPTGELLSFAEDAETPTQTVYGYVPIAIVKEFLAEHGGIKEGKLP